MLNDSTKKVWSSISKGPKREGRVVAIIQARMGSVRLPGKVLLELGGVPLLKQVVERVRAAKRLDEVVVATTVLKEDDPIALFCQREEIPVFRGDSEDVLNRYHEAAKAFGAEGIVRITADCPLMDPEVIDRVVDRYLEEEADYVTNTLRTTYPDGEDVEVFSFAALERAWRQAHLPAEREHVTPYFKTCGAFQVANVEYPGEPLFKGLRWTVDEPEDLLFVRRVYEELGCGGKGFGMPEVLELIQRKPELLKINEGLIRNEGYYLSLAQEPPVPERVRKMENSWALKERACAVIPGGSQTFSKGPTQFVQPVAPTFLKRGQGCRVWDVDGNEYVDFCMALGPIILGYNDPVVQEAVARQMKDGVSFSLPHPLEVELAELLIQIIPSAQMVRFGKNGSDATSGAVRLARAYTGRDIIACCGYHGWQDWFIGTTTRNKGVPLAVRNLTLPFEYNKIDPLKQIFAEHPRKIAAVILEPMGVEEPRDNFLAQVRELTRKEGALLIFDEVLTGFRFALGGAQEYFGVTPDLSCFGKALANGYPLSAVVGPREIMKGFEEVFFSFTFGGEALSLAAAVATIRQMQKLNVVAHLWQQGEKLRDGVRVLARQWGLGRFVACVGLSPRSAFVFKDEAGRESLLMKSLFQQECLKRGVLFTGVQNICYAHGDADCDEALRVYRTAFEVLALALERKDWAKKLEGEPVQPVFRKA